MKRCKESRIRLHVGYGMTETAGQIAIGSLADLEKDGMRLMPGVSVRIVDQGPDGYGKLAIKGSCLCNGYFTARMATTADGFFLTGDTAQFRNGCLMVRERTDDVFVSGGENIFPAEIRRKMLSCQGVSEAYVYGALDARGERRPIAFVERSDMGMRGGGTGRQFVARLRKSLATSVSRNAMPAFIFPLEGFPRTKTGQVDTRLLENCFEERIEIVRIALHTVSVPFARPLRVGRESLATREALLVEVVDYQGRVGIGECSSFGQPLFSTEVLRSDRDFIQHVLAPRVLNSAFLHPNEVYSSLAECPGALKYPLAMSAVESALWDLYGKITKMPLWQLIGGQPTEAKGMQVRLRASAMVGLGSAQETVESVWRCAEAGYGRVVIQVVPQGAFECVNAVRQVFPDLSICLDAGQSFTEKHFDELLKLDSLGIDWIKEPLAFDCSTRTAVERFQLLSDLQERMETPICLDQSIQGTEDAYKALRFRNLRHVAVHVSRFGGIRPTLDFIRCAQAQGVKPWMDNSYDLGVSRRVLAAFQTIPGVEDRGNIGSVLRDFTNDIADPPYTVERGLVTINRAAEPHGVGCRVDDFTMGKALVKTIVVE